MLFEKSEWIWNKKAGTLNTFADFLINFDAHTNNKYVLYISACHNYTVKLNSIYIPSSQREGYENEPEYQILDLSDKVTEGKNRIVITVYSQGTDSFIWKNRMPGLIFDFQENSATIAYSCKDTLSRINNSFISGEMEKISSMLGYTFKADLTKIPKVFKKESIVVDKNKNLVRRNIKDLDVLSPASSEIISQGNFIDSSQKSTPIGKKAYNAYLSTRVITDIVKDTFLGLYDNSFILDNSKKYCFETTENCDGIYLTIDFKKNIVGYPMIDIEAYENAKMIVSYGEHIDDMRPRSSPATYQFAFEIMLKKGQNKFIFPIRRTACRYMMALIYTKNVNVSYIGMRECLYPVENLSFFKCSDSIHEKIFNVAQRTLRLCMHDHYEDCPSREQAMYIMDTQVQALCGYYALGEYDFPKSCFKMLLNSFNEDNFFEMISPGKSDLIIPCFTINYISLIWEYYLFSGDIDMLYNTYPIIKRVIEERLPYFDSETGLVPSPCGEKYWNFIEWKKGNDGVVGANDATCLNYTLFNMSYNAFYSMACSAYSNICNNIGKSFEASRFDEIRNKLNKAIHKYFWNDEMSAYKSSVSFEKDIDIYYTELANSLAICAGICPKECIPGALDALSGGNLEKITISHARYKYDALMVNSDKYSDLIMKEIADIWGGMIFKGATSFWETERGAKDFSLSGSQCHGWSSVPIYVYFRYCIGIYPKKPGFKEYSVEPKVNNYKFNAEFSTPSGKISV